MEHRVALSHASGLAAEAILEKLPESGITSDSLVLLDHESNVGKRLAYAGAHLKLQDQRSFDLSSCALLLMPEADAELETSALNQGCLLVSHVIQRDTPALFVAANGPQPEIAPIPRPACDLPVPSFPVCCPFYSSSTECYPSNTSM